MGTYALHAAHFVLPSQMVEDGYLTVVDGKFGSWSPERPEMDIVELGDAFVSPGIVDTHIHGFFGHATTDCDAEGINEASLAPLPGCRPPSRTPSRISPSSASRSTRQ